MSSPQERSAAIIAGLEDLDLDFILHLPSSTLATVISHFEGAKRPLSYPVTREEEAIGIMSGLALGGKKAALIIQDNGLGNALTALATFPQAYHIPLFMLISQRGGLNEYNSMIHSFCEHAEAVADSIQLRHFSLSGHTPIEEWRAVVPKTFKFSQITHRPVALFCDLMGGRP